MREVLEALSDDEIRGLAEGSPSRGSWGRSGRAEVDGSSVFVKRLPVTAVEAERWPSTRNHFGLPVQYQYGVGSAGFGAAREAVAHRTVTGWVLDGATDAFPQLHHARLLPAAGDGWSPPLDAAAYGALWGDDAAIVAYVAARVAATHELWLVVEHLPHTLATWLVDHQDRVDDVLDRLLGAARLMREHGLVHFDAHFGNVVVDDSGRRVCLTDFGLALDAGFELAPEERAFLDAHRHYDLGEILFSLTAVLPALYGRLSEPDRDRVDAVCGLPGAAPARDRIGPALLEHAGRLADEDLLALHPRYVAALERFRPVIDLMGDLYRRLVRDPGKRARHDDVELVSRLRTCGVDL